MHCKGDALRVAGFVWWYLELLIIMECLLVTQEAENDSQKEG